MGKSTLVNGIVGAEVASEGKSLKPETKSVESIVREIKPEHLKNTGKYKVVIWDSPGLQDGSVNEEKYLADMKEKCTVDIVIYCIKAVDTRANSAEFDAISKLTKTFGKEWWSNGVFVLTFANTLEVLAKTEAEFERRINNWRKKIHEALKSAAVPKEIATKVPVIPAGYAEKPNLPGIDFWLGNLWFQVILRTKEKSAALLIEMNQPRIKKPEEVSKNDFTSKAIHEQPIVLDSERLAVAIAGQVGFAIGAALGAVVGGIVGIGAGAAIGATVGGAAGAASGLAAGGVFSWWRRRKKRKELESHFMELKCKPQTT